MPIMPERDKGLYIPGSLKTKDSYFYYKFQDVAHANIYISDGIC